MGGMMGGGGGKGGKGGKSSESSESSTPTVVNNSNPAMDAYLADQANQTQMALQNQNLNAQLMNAQQTPQPQPGMHVAQVQEEQGLPAGRDVWATIDALRGN